MEKPELDTVFPPVDELSVLNRNRSFKSKQLVRSQAIRETQSPPRTASPAPAGTESGAESTITVITRTPTMDDVGNSCDPRTRREIPTDNSSHSDNCRKDVSYVNNDDFNDYKMKPQPVEIQITSGNWDQESQSDQRQNTKQPDEPELSPDLLSNNPRVTCVCGNCSACPHCRGRRRRNYCPVKQDSGIICPDECLDCIDNEVAAPNNDVMPKPSSLDADEQTYYCRCPEKKDKPKNIPLTRIDSDDKSEPTGPELVNFIRETLNKNSKDRVTLLKIEKELHALVNDAGRCIVRFPVMTSYGRMLVHRCASLFQLSHHLDQSSKSCVMVSKSGTSGGRIPCTSFKQWCTVNFPPSPQRYQPESTHARFILKRDAHSLDEPSGGLMPSNRSKSLEQREREYERVRRRIFSTDNCSQDESQWPWMSGPIKLLTSDGGRNKLLKVQSLESSSPATGGSCRVRGAVSKSHSFSGRAPDTPPTRLLSRHGDLASSSWRLSPSSSGYKTLSLRSTDSVTPSPTGGASPEPTLGAVGTESVVWAVSKLSSVPAGAVVLHPQTGRPLMNPDGSLYLFDPAHPPVLYDVGYRQEEFQIDNSEKRRGRLEKQHSFIDNDCECQPPEEYRSKCCPECRRHESCQPKSTIDKETNTKPETPTETQSQVPPCEQSKPANHVQQNDPSTNQGPPQTASADQGPPQTASANQGPPQTASANQGPPQAAPTNHGPASEASANRNEAECTCTHKPTDQTPECGQQNSQAAVEAQRGIEAVAEPTDHRQVSEDRQPNAVDEECQGIHQYQDPYAQGYPAGEVTSALQATGQFMQADLSTMQPNVARVTPVAMPDPITRPLSLTNMLYSTALPQTYPYVNQCRIDPTLQPALYHGLIPTEDVNKMAPSPLASDNTFRIDSSYPYGTIEYAAPCGSCLDTNSLQNPHRSYSVPYNQIEMQPVLQPSYPISNIVMPQPHLQPYTFQEPMPWANVQASATPVPKIMMSDMYPLLNYPSPSYSQYNLMYPPVIPPQPYSVCQPMYPMVEKQPEQASRTAFRPRSKYNPCGHNPEQTPSDSLLRRQDNSEIAIKIQQIKEQMAQLNAKEKEKKEEWKKEDWKRDDWKKDDWKRDDWKRRSSNGILGSYPSNNHHDRAHGRTANDDSRLSTEARVIVNSIRNMQYKNTYQNDSRAPGPRSPRGRGSRDDVHPHPRPTAPEWQQHRSRPIHPLSTGAYRPSSYLFRQMSPNTWCRRSPAPPIHSVLNNPRRPHPDSRNGNRR